MILKMIMISAMVIMMTIMFVGALLADVDVKKIFHKNNE